MLGREAEGAVRRLREVRGLRGQVRDREGSEDVVVRCGGALLSKLRKREIRKSRWSFVLDIYHLCG